MATFSDDFERGDGGLGNSWIVTNGSWSISGGVAVNGLNQSRAYNQLISGAGRHEAYWTWQIAGGALTRTTCLIKADFGTGTGYAIDISGTAASPSFSICRTTSSGSTNIITGTTSALSDGTHSAKLVYDGGLLTLWIDGGRVCGVVNTLHDANTAIGILGHVSGSSHLNGVAFAVAEALSFSVSPSPIGNYGLPVDVTFTGVGTAWNSTNPTFTVSAGLLSDQVIVSDTVATATYAPGYFLGVATFTDPSTMATAVVTVTSDVSLVPPTVSPITALSELAVQWLEDQAGHGGLVLADNDETGGSVAGIDLKGAFGELLLGVRTGASPSTGYSASADIVRSIFARLWGGEEWEGVSFAEPGTGALKTDLLALAAILSLAKTGGSYDVGSLARELSGFPGGSHQDILDAISGVSGGDNQEVLDAISALQGDPLATVKAVLDLVYAIGTTEGYDLADVKTWVEAARGVGLPTIKAVRDDISNLSQYLVTVFSLLQTEIAGLATITGIAEVIVPLITGEGASTIADVLTDIGNLSDKVDTISGGTAGPLWPGLDNVTLGDAVAISDGMTIEGPFDGLIFAIDGHPSGASYYGFGSRKSWRYVGSVMFLTDRGDSERAESIGIESQLVAPRTMLHAGSAILRLNGGWTGTVRTWTANV